MFSRRRLASAMAVLLILATALPTAAATVDGRRAADAKAFDGRLIVTWKGLAPATLGMAGVAAVAPTARPMRSIVQARDGAAADLAARLRRDPRVLAVVPDAQMTLTDWPVDEPPDDPHYVDQPNLEQIGVPEVWTTTTGAPSVVVAVIDSGVDLTHPDLDGVTVVDPRNEVWNNADVTDEVGHGTYVSATIVAETDNAEGIAGIAPSSSLMPIKIADDQGFISFADILDAVDWAREHEADIVNMSLGGLLTPEQAALGQPTFTAARDAGVLMVAASGNDGIALRSYPASFRGVVSVGAVDGDDVLAEFSTYGKALDITAPGVDLWSAFPGGLYEAASGTSAASPHVAGVAALIWAARPALSNVELEAVLRASAVDLGDPGKDTFFGDGRVDAAAALVEAVPDPIPDLEPPFPLPALQLTFVAPAAAVTQTGSRYTVQLEVNHDVSDAFALLGRWRIDAGKCDYRSGGLAQELEFALTMPLTGLRQGRCYRVLVVAIDEDGNFAEAMSKPIRVVDPIVPTIVRRSPHRDETGVDRSANIRIRFSEPVVGGTVRLRNLRTGLIVRTTSRWIASTNTLVLDPALRMYGRTRYQVEVSDAVQDRTGNPVGAQSWVFRTGH